MYKDSKMKKHSVKTESKAMTNSKKKWTKFNWITFPWKWEAYVEVKKDTCAKKFLKQMTK